MGERGGRGMGYGTRIVWHGTALVKELDEWLEVEGEREEGMLSVTALCLSTRSCWV